MLGADDIIALLELKPHPEGGHYAETHRSPLRVVSDAHTGPRSAGTAIYFLLRTGEFSAVHRVCSDEAWHHYLGDPLELWTVHQDGRAACLLLGPGLEAGQRPQIVVPAGVYQAARPQPGPFGYTLCGCTVAPGFDFADFEMPSRDALLASLPEHADWVRAFTR